MTAMATVQESYSWLSVAAAALAATEPGAACGPAIGRAASAPQLSTPMAAISNPVDGSKVSGYVVVQGTATDAVGVAKMRLYIDGGLVSSVNGSSLKYRWSTQKIAAGKHTVVLRHRGHTVATQDVDIAVGQTKALSLRVELVDRRKAERPSLVGPSVLLGAGVLAAVAGGVMAYEGSKDDAETKWIFPQVAPGGIALGIVGAGAIVSGGVLLLKAHLSRSAPVVAAGPRGAYLGWVSRF